MKTFCLMFLAVVALIACGKTGDYSRGVFHGLVIEKTSAEAQRAAGKPDSIEQRGKNQLWVYNFKTFDSENMNQVDKRTSLVIDASGKVSSVEYEPTTN